MLRIDSLSRERKRQNSNAEVKKQGQGHRKVVVPSIFQFFLKISSQLAHEQFSAISREAASLGDSSKHERLENLFGAILLENGIKTHREATQSQPQEKLPHPTLPVGNEAEEDMCVVSDGITLDNKFSLLPYGSEAMDSTKARKRHLNTPAQSNTDVGKDTRNARSTLTAQMGRILGSTSDHTKDSESAVDLLSSAAGDGEQALAQDDGDGLFITVSHRRNRKHDIPFIIRLKEDGGLRGANPRKLHARILKAAGESPARLTMAKQGAIATDVGYDSAVTLLLAAKNLNGTAVLSTTAAAYMRNTATVRGIPTHYSYSQLKEYVKDQGVTIVKRRHRQQEGNPPTQFPTDQVMLSFPPQHRTSRED